MLARMTRQTLTATPPRRDHAPAPPADQLGVFTSADAALAGIPPFRIKRRVAQGRWVRLRRGVFIESERCAAASPAQRHLIAAAAAVRAGQGDAFLSLRTAALLHGLSSPSPVPVAPELGVPRARRGCLTGVIEHTHRVSPPGHHLTAVRGLPVTTVERTLADLALAGFRREAVIAADEALARGLATPSGLNRIVKDLAGVPRSERLEILNEATGASSSAVTSVLRRAVLDAGLPEPACGHRVTLSHGRRVPLPLVWDAEGIVVLEAGNDAASALRVLGRTVITVTEDDALLRTPAVIRAIAFALQASRATPLTPRLRAS
jgi:hypothetical protein